MKDTLCEKPARKPCSSTDCRWCLSTGRSTSHVPPEQTWLVAHFGCVRIPCRTARRVRPWTGVASPSFGFLRKGSPRMSWRRPSRRVETLNSGRICKDWWHFVPDGKWNPRSAYIQGANIIQKLQKSFGSSASLADRFRKILRVLCAPNASWLKMWTSWLFSAPTKATF